jgi:hypothetical protein
MERNIFLNKVSALQHNIELISDNLNIDRNSNELIEVKCTICNNITNLKPRTLLDKRKIKFCNYCNLKVTKEDIGPDVRIG